MLALFYFMKKTYYFSHDYNAHSDVKILFLRQQLGMEGYGIYWFVVESLANAGGKLPLKILPVLSMQMQTSEIKVLSVIKEFGLFEVIENEFFSSRLSRSLDTFENIRKINSDKGKKSAEKRKITIAAVQPLLNNSSTAVEQQLNNGSTKERKGKESKDNTIVLSENFQPAKEILDAMCYNVEEYMLTNTAKMEALCMKTGKSLVEAKRELEKCHLHLEKKGLYPLQKKAAIAWYTSWLMNAKDFNAKYYPSQAEKKSGEAPKKNIDEIIKKYQ